MEKEIFEIVEQLDNIYSNSKNHISTFHKKGFKKIDHLLGIFILERIVGNLNSIRYLLSICNENPDIEPSIGLILRNNLSLCKIVFIENDLKENKQNLTDFYKVVFGENFKKTIISLKLQGVSDSEIHSSLEVIKVKYSFILKEANINLETIEKEKLTTYKLSSKFETLENIYIAFSKYEHFGLSSIILQSNENYDEKLTRIKIAIHYSLRGILICLNTLQIIDDKLITLIGEFNRKTMNFQV